MLTLDELKQYKKKSAKYYTNPAGTSQVTRYSGAKSAENLPRIIETGRKDGMFNSSGVLQVVVDLGEDYSDTPYIEVIVHTIIDDRYFKLPMRDSDGINALLSNISDTGFQVDISSNPVDDPYPDTKAEIHYRAWSFDVV